MKRTKQLILLILLFIAAGTYAYAFAMDAVTLIYFSKPFIAPLAALYYLAIAKNVKKLFLIALFFAFIGNIFLIKPSQGFFVLGMSSGLVFILVNMLIIADKIGEMNTTRFFKIAMAMIVILMGVLYFMFYNEGEITMLYYIFGIVTAIYASFSIYLFLDKKSKSSLLNLIGVILYLLGAIARGFDYLHNDQVIFRIFNIITYTLSLYFIARAYAEEVKKVDLEVQ